MAPELNTIADQERLLKLAQEKLRRRTAGLPPITPVNRDGRLVLSFAQQRLWFLEQLGGLGSTYHMASRLRFSGALAEPALRRALDTLMTRHESLRTTFFAVHGEPEQRIAPAETSRFALLEHDLREHAEPGMELRRLAAAAANVPFDLERGPLIRGSLIRVADEQHVLLLTMHHIVSDGWSLGVLRREVSALYEAFRAGEADPLPPLTVQYADYAAWQRRWVDGEELQRQATYWQDTLTGATELLQLPTDRPRPAERDYAGAALPFAVDAELTAGLKALARRGGTTLFHVLLAGWAAVLSRLSGQQDVLIGTPTANRVQPELDELIGFFVNTVVVRVDLTGEPTVAELLERVKRRALEAQQHQDIPFEQVVERIRPVRSLAHTPIFQVMFAWQNLPATELDLTGPGLGAPRGAADAAPRAAKFDITLTLSDAGREIRGAIEFATALFDRATMERHVGYLRRTLEHMVADDQQRIAELSILPPGEWHDVIDTWNATAAPYRNDARLHELIEAQIARTPDAVALVFEDEQVSYGALEARANALAHHLRTLGVGPDTRVALCLERNVELVVALVGVLKAGGAYVSLDPRYPTERLRFILADSAPTVVLTAGNTLPVSVNVPVLDLVADRAVWAAASPGCAPAGDVGPEQVAYLIYTSGSTGTPKGVAITHRNVVNFVTWAGTAFTAAELAHTLAATSLNFDLAVFECFVPLTIGGCVHVVRDALVLVERRPRHETITLINTVPSTLQALVTAGVVPSSVQTVNVAGEPLARVLVEQVFATTGVGRVCNLYGPSETTTYSTWVSMPRATGFVSHIGRPVANTQVYVLDGRRQPVPVGVVGELYIGGAGVARGYLSRPAKTAECFVADPFSVVPGARLYRTGDQGRWRADGALEFLGRGDFQVKVRGYRIELGEIEAKLLEHPAVQDAVVVTRPDGQGSPRLVGYYVGAGAGGETLRAFLGERLPEHMVPAAWVQLEVLPRTPNGKIDRKSLPDPAADALADDEYEAPATPTEMTLAECWRELLHVKRVDRRADFFALGGHSLRAVQLIWRVQQALGIAVDLSEIFRRPVLSDLARALESAVPAVLPGIRTADRSGSLPLSFAQQRLWFLERLGGLGSTYHMWLQVALNGPLNLPALVEALNGLVGRHEILRTTFIAVDGEPRQRIAPVGEIEFALVQQNLASTPEAAEVLRRSLAEELAAPFDLELGPLIRGRLVRLTPDHHILFVTMHHIVSDGWSMGVLKRELSALYQAYANGTDDPLPPLPIQYADYAVWQREQVEGEIWRRQSAYWQETLADVTHSVLELPADRPRPSRQDHTGAAVHIDLPSELTFRLKALSRDHGTTLFMTILAGYALVLARLSRQDDVLVGIPSANRNRAEVEDLIGFFVNTLPIRVNFPERQTVAQLLEQVKVRTLEAQQHQDISFEQVVQLLHPNRSLSHSPIVQVLLNWHNTPRSSLTLPNLQLSRPKDDVRTNASFDLSLSLSERGGRVIGRLVYATALFDRDTVARYAGYLRQVLDGMVTDPQRLASQVPFMPDSERRETLQRSIAEAAATGAQDRDERYLHEPFETQAARTPDAVAVVAAGEQLTYSELNARANRLAWYLKGLGVGPESRVALCLERTPDLVMGILAVLKAGGAYVPLDPTYPPERLRFILTDSAPRAVLTHGSLAGQMHGLFAGLAIPVLHLDAPDRPWDACPTRDGSRHRTGLAARDLAYVMYTSGSTGWPKGVLHEHGGAMALIRWYVDRLAICERDDVLVGTSYAFDLSQRNLLGPFFAGGRVHLTAEPFDPGGIVAHIGASRISVTNLTPTAFRALVQNGVQRELGAMRFVIFGGEPVAKDDLMQLEVPGTHFLNAYGPTECSGFVTCQELSRDLSTYAARSIPIGRPVSESRVYILDAAGEPVPVGVIGELYIGGLQVARGYVNRPSLTAQSFVPDPWSGEGGARLYATGDLGRWLPDGTIEFIGREDAQVKLRGHRIELGEIESRLRMHRGVRDAAVVMREDSRGDRRLVAYVVASDAAPDAATLRAHLGVTLPEVMIPASYVWLDALPRTPNGKLDRRTLPEPDRDAYAQRGYEAPLTAHEIIIAEVWAEVLGVERVGRHDHFFELGGHSLLAVKVIDRMRRRGRQLDVRTLFVTPILADLAATVGAQSRDVEVPPNLIPNLPPSDAEPPSDYVESSL
jgi:amino acid adenylation domain-containing protein